MEPEDKETDAGKSERKYQVFISSTFRDLADQRRMVLHAVVDRGHMPIALERFPAADSAVPSVIHKSIAASQIYTSGWSTVSGARFSLGGLRRNTTARSSDRSTSWCQRRSSLSSLRRR